MTVMIQKETTGRGIASVANIVGESYVEVKSKANAMGIFAGDSTLYSDTQYVCNLLREYDVQVSSKEIPFKSWKSLPDVALLSTKYHEKNGLFFWHWVVFKREQGISVVLDSAAYLKENKRIDFQNIKPKWFIEVLKT